VRLEYGRQYNEPPDWYFPVRHFLGAMLLDAGRPQEAEVVFAADLNKNPENGYSLFGLKIALERQGKNEDALLIAERFDRAWKDASHQLVSSRFW
jgi:tetratricopeptide (TPR) repeat protein